MDKLRVTLAIVPKADAPKLPFKGIEVIALDRLEQAMEQLRGT